MSENTAKTQSKRLKASGLQKLRFYCQLCDKQCRDANGFKNHVLSPSHQGRLAAMSTDPRNGVVAKYSEQFETEFLRLLKSNHGTKKINAIRFYHEYITNDKHHVHMNSTKWLSLTSFVKHLGRSGRVRVEIDGEDTELNFSIAFIDASSTQSLQKYQEKDKKDEDLVASRLLQKQMEKGKEREETSKGTENTKPQLPKLLTPLKPLKISISKGPVKRKLAAFDSDSEEEAGPTPKK